MASPELSPTVRSPLDDRHTSPLDHYTEPSMGHGDLEPPKPSHSSPRFALESTPSDDPQDSSHLRLAIQDYPDQQAVDGYADRLMDDLFMDVEHSLDSGVALLDTEDPVEVLKIQALAMPPVSLPAALVPRRDAYSPQGTLMEASAQGLGYGSQLLDRVLLGAVMVSCGLTLGLWALDHDRYQNLWASGTAPAPAPAPAVDPILEANTKFATYLQDSLDRLASQTTNPPGLDPNPTGGPADPTTPQSDPAAPDLTNSVATLPTVTIPGTPNIGKSLSPLPSPPPTVLERVYIPVYPNTPGMPVPPSNLPGVTNLAPPLAAANLPSVPVLGGTGAPSSPTQPNSEAATNSDVTPVPNVVESSPAVLAHTLVGVLELGDRSAALFQVNGVTRRVNLGEAVGSSGWTLVDVSNEEAIIRRNGDVRSVYIGQNF